MSNPLEMVQIKHHQRGSCAMALPECQLPLQLFKNVTSAKLKFPAR
jgi:hypothetical protein